MTGDLYSDHDAFDLVDGNTFRATGITAYLSNGGTIEHAQQIAGHASPKTTKLYDRTSDAVWQQVDGGSPAAAARRLIMASTTRLVSARPVSLWPARSTL